MDEVKNTLVNMWDDWVGQQAK